MEKKIGSRGARRDAVANALHNELCALDTASLDLEVEAERVGATVRLARIRACRSIIRMGRALFAADTDNAEIRSALKVAKGLFDKALSRP